MTPYRMPSRRQRKWRKFRREPVRFFADAKTPLVRTIGLWALAGYLCVFDRTHLQVVKRLFRDQRQPKTIALTPGDGPIHTDFGLNDAGDSQCFALTGVPPLNADNWIEIELCANGEDFGTWLQPVLVADDPDGANPILAGLPTIKEGCVQTLVRIPRNVRALSLIPVAGAQNIALPHVRICQVPRLRALRWLLQGGYSLPDALIELCDSMGTRHAAQLRAAMDNLTCGQHIQLIRDSMLFNPEFYLATHEDVRAAGLDAAEHYYRFGAQEGRNPGPHFDTGQYLHDNPDVKLSGVNALVHYLRYGREERRRVHWREMPVAPKLSAPTASNWDALERRLKRRKAKTAATDVVVPVYRGFDDTLACLYSVLGTNVRVGYELVVIDDCSPEPALTRELRRLAKRGLFTLLRNKSNLGFVESANRGMALHGDRDVVLLNSDTVVYGNWLDRLRRHAVSAPDVATVTPLSNNATICSYPRSNRNNDTLIEIDFAALDALAAKTNSGHAVAAPTGVGFCLFVRRDCLDAVGLFDAGLFGRGYGEENDLCQKAIRLGMRNLIATDVFVRHTGEVSFAGTAGQAKAKALRRLAGRFPDYKRDVGRFVEHDPIAPARRALDLARLVHAAGGAAPVLFVTHGRGGGVERHIRDTIAKLRRAGTGALLLRSTQGVAGELTLNSIDEIHLPNLNPVARDGAVDGLEDILRRAGVSRIEIHNLADYPQDAGRRVGALAEALGVSYGFTVHDYFSICPRINLIDSSGVYCGETGEAACRTCLAEGEALPGGRPDIAVWRAGYAALLSGAAVVRAPSHDAARRIERYFPGLDVTVRPHEERIRPPAGYRPPVHRPGEKLRVAVIGAIGPHKGSAVLLECARDALTRNLPLEFVIIGYSDRHELGRMRNVIVTGRYEEHEVFDLIKQYRCHIGFLPSVCPETHSYVLSTKLAAGLFPVTFDVGAQAARLLGNADSVVLPRELFTEPAHVNDRLLAAMRCEILSPANDLDSTESASLGTCN